MMRPRSPFNASLKVERAHRTVYPTREHARKDVARYRLSESAFVHLDFSDDFGTGRDDSITIFTTLNSV